MLWLWYHNVLWNSRVSVNSQMSKGVFALLTYIWCNGWVIRLKEWNNSKANSKSRYFSVYASLCSFFVSELNYHPFLTATVLKRAVHPLLLPLLRIQSCVLGFQTVFHVCIRLFNVCGVEMGVVAINAAERIVWTVLLLWAEKVIGEPSSPLW
jgi:hypothetical protein